METQNKPVLVVEQPHKLGTLLTTLDAIDRVSEFVSSGPSNQMSGGQGASSGQGDDGTVSAREQAIANIPEPVVMQKELQKEIQKEVKMLRKEVNKITKLSKAGNAYQLNKLYGRIRRLNKLLSELVDASFDVLKRLFIKVFIDKQSVI